MIVVLALAGCDHSFEPYEPSDLRFSIMGYIDASADTQWIRVTPVRTSVAYRSEEPLDISVVLERLNGTETIVLRDSLFSYQPTGLGDGIATNAHNFWTDEEIHPDTEYRLVVTRSDGAVSTGHARVPPDYAVAVEYQQVASNLAVVEVPVGHLGPLSIRRYPEDPSCSEWPFFEYPFPVPEPEGGMYRVPVNGNLWPPPGCFPYEQRVFVPAAGIDWPSGIANAAWAFPIRDGLTPLEFAEGFFAGVNSKEVLWEPCVLEPRVGPCRLTYHDDSGALVGTIVDAECGGPPRGGRSTGPTIRLIDILDDPGAPVRVRPFDAGQAGTFRYTGIDPGRSYILRADYPTAETLGSPSIRIYGTSEDTIFVGPADTVEVEIQLPRQIAC